jgi:hypothetical protein
MQNFAKRSKFSLLVEDTRIYSNDLQRITLLRDKAFKHWTVDGNETSKANAEKEWQRYNHILEIMEICLYRLHEITLKQKPVKK